MKHNRSYGLLVAAIALLGMGTAMAADATDPAASGAPQADDSSQNGGPQGRDHHWGHGDHWNHGHHHHHHHHGRFAHRAGSHGGFLVGGLLHATRQLNLTADQRTSIKNILSKARDEDKAAAGANTKPDFAVLANPGDAQYAAAVQNAKTAVANRIQQQSALETQIYNVLTPAQKAQLPSVLSNMKGRGGPGPHRAAWQQQPSRDGNS